MLDERHSLHRRSTLLLAAALLVPLTLLVLRHPSPSAPLAWSVAAGAVLLGAALLSRRPRWATPAYYVAATASAIASVGIVMGTGGTTGPRFGFLLALPPIVLVVVPELPWASALTGAVTVAGSLLLMAREGRGGWVMVEWAAVALLVVGLSYRASVGFRRLWYEQLEREARYASAMLQLAESEKLRARSERVNLVARLAARLSHELNNPLAAVKANVACLADCELPAADLAFRETLADTRASVDRMALIAAELRTLATMAPGEAARCDVAGVLERVVARLDDAVRSRITLRAAPTLAAVVDCGLLGYCVRHLVMGAASLDERAGRRGLSLEAACRSGGIRIELVSEGGASPQPPRGPSDDPARAFHCGHAGLHFAVADELARALGGALEAARLPDGAQRIAVTLPGSQTASA